MCKMKKKFRGVQHAARFRRAALRHAPLPLTADCSLIQKASDFPQAVQNILFHTVHPLVTVGIPDPRQVMDFPKNIPIHKGEKQPEQDDLFTTFALQTPTKTQNKQLLLPILGQKVPS